MIDKEKFLQEYYPSKSQDKTKKNCRDKFNWFKNYEDKYCIDLYDFNSKQLIDVLSSKNIRSTKSLSSFFSIYNTYIKWAAKETNRDPVHNEIIDIKKLFKEHDLYNNVIKNELKSILTRRDMYDVIKNVYNAQDKAILALLFEGIKGKSESELLELKSAGVKGRELTLQKGRIIIPTQAAKIVKDAIKQQLYFKGNGVTTAKGPTILLNDYGYVLKRPFSTRKDTKKLTLNTLRGRIKALQNYTGIDNLSAEKLYKSGVLDYFFTVEAKKSSSLESIDFKRVCLWLGMDIYKNFNWSYYRILYKEYKTFYNLNVKAKFERHYDKDFDDIYNAIMKLEIPNINEDDEIEQLPQNKRFIGQAEYEPDSDLGELGEEVVLKYLQETYPDEEVEQVSVTRKNEYPGYDIEHKRKFSIECIEVKSTKRNDPFIVFPTYNEMNCAKTIGNNYSLYVVEFNRNSKPISIYRILNFSSLFDTLEFDFITHQIESDQLFSIRSQKYVLIFKKEFLQQYKIKTFSDL